VSSASSSVSRLKASNAGRARRRLLVGKAALKRADERNQRAVERMYDESLTPEEREAAEREWRRNGPSVLYIAEAVDAFAVSHDFPLHSDVKRTPSARRIRRTRVRRRARARSPGRQADDPDLDRAGRP
jgi:hypothetical protein